MPIFPTLRELLLRTVFQDWIVDDGNYITQAVLTLMAIMTPLQFRRKSVFKIHFGGVKRSQFCWSASVVICGK